MVMVMPVVVIILLIVPIVISVVVVVIVAVHIVVAVMVDFTIFSFLSRLWPCHVSLVPIDGFLSFMMIVRAIISVVVGRIMRGINETVGLHYFHVPSGAVAMPTVAMSNSAQYVSQSDYRDAQNQQGSGAGYAPSKIAARNGPFHQRFLKVRIASSADHQKHVQGKGNFQRQYPNIQTTVPARTQVDHRKERSGYYQNDDSDSDNAPEFMPDTSNRVTPDTCLAKRRCRTSLKKIIPRPRPLLPCDEPIGLRPRANLELVSKFSHLQPFVAGNHHSWNVDSAPMTPLTSVADVGITCPYDQAARNLSLCLFSD